MKINKQLNQWSNYWQGGVLTSLPHDFKENYDGAILNEWNKTFSKLSTKSKVLDLCTGNCAIALLASHYIKKHNLDVKITAIDGANISKSTILKKHPSQEQYLSIINIIPNCRIEDINLDADTYDIITSQYGIEYSNWEKSAEQVFRLLKKNGTFTMICHSNSTEIIKFMSDEDKSYSLLNSIQYFENIYSLLKSKISYIKFKKRLDDIKTQIVEAYKKEPSDLLFSTLSMINQIQSIDKKSILAKSKALLDYCNQHRYANLRLQDLLDVTNRINDNPNWYKKFIDMGLTLTEKKEVLQNSYHNSGILYSFKK